MRDLDEKIRTAILQKISPTEEEIAKQQRVIEILRQALIKEAEKTGRDYRFIEAQGSTGPKQTQLRGASDIDLFVGLSPDRASQPKTVSAERNRELSAFFDDIVDSWFRPAAEGIGAKEVMKAYSQHPYLSLVMNGLDVDIIGCFDLSKEYLAEQGPITAVDRTVHHTKYVASRLTDRLRDDIRILKSFVRASHAYGDACAVGQMGVTGYAIELLVLSENGIDRAIDRLLQLKTMPVDPLHRSEEELRKIPGFRDDYVIIVDPTDTQRNVASSFSPRAVQWIVKRLSHLRELDREENSDEIIDLFLESPIPTSKLPDWLQPHCISRSFRVDGTAHYTLYRDKLYRLVRRIASTLRQETTGETRFGDVLWEIYFEGEIFSVGFIVEYPSINESFLRRGPPTRLEQAAEKFKNSHPDLIEQDGHLWAVITRRWTNARELIDHLVKNIEAEGFERSSDPGPVPARVLNTLYRYIMRIEQDFPLSKRQEYKEALRTLDW
ncbi:MAG: hypothetical protein K9W43_02285 [Candidatus Thorarchaeota archaeon]|nr:hypothetical protein [Candidatus Thorarchaeota archaeon]